MPTHRLLFLAVLVTGIFAAVLGRAEEVQWRKLGDAPGFPGLRRELQSIVDHHRGAAHATFCVVLRDGGRDPLLYALWTQAHLLYRWRTTRDPQLGDATLLLHEPLDLRKDIVRTHSDELSTYKVSRAWVDDVQLQCHAHGEDIQIPRSAP